MSESLLIKHIDAIYGIADKPYPFKRGKAMSLLDSMENAFILIDKGKILDYGPMDRAPDRADRIISARGSLALPSWNDSHTHIVFPASREMEFIDKINGLSYEEIAQRGGGILNTAKKMALAPEEQLLETAIKRVEEMIEYGTGAIEIKSGYGLNFESEMKMLRVIRELKYLVPIPVKATFLGAHALPERFKKDRASFIKRITDYMLPYIYKEGLADYVDVFCDRGFFTVEETDIILQKAAHFGLIPKIHANELDYSGGIQVGVKNNALSVDHLEYTGDEEIEVLKNSNTIPTLLPSTAFFLRLKYAPARKMIDSGLGVALASDYNPGSSPSGNMPFVLSLACIHMKMLPEEAINAATINSAYAMGLENQTGTISKGKQANIIITRPLDNVAQIPYYFGRNPVKTAIINGGIFSEN
jgi:imidazolonepropionase